MCSNISIPITLPQLFFAPEEKETSMEWTMLFETTELFETVVTIFKADEGLKQNVEKLTVYIETQLNKIR